MFRLASFTTRQLNGVGIRLPAVVASGLGLTTFTATDGVYYGSWYDNSYLNFGFLISNNSYSTISSALQRMMPGDTFVVSDGIRKQTLTLGYDIANPYSFGSFSSTDYGGYIDWAAGVMESNLNYNAGSGLFANTITSIAIPVDTSGTSILKTYNGNINTATAGTVIGLSISPSMIPSPTPTEVLAITVAGIGDENTDVYNMYSGTIEIRTSDANYWTTLHVTGQETAYKRSNPPYTTTYHITVQETLTSYNQYGTIVIYGIRYTPGANGTHPGSGGGGGNSTTYNEGSDTFLGPSTGAPPYVRSRISGTTFTLVLNNATSQSFVTAMNALTIGTSISVVDQIYGTQSVTLTSVFYPPFSGATFEQSYATISSNPWGTGIDSITSMTVGSSGSSGTTYTAGTDYSGSMPGGMIIFSNPSGYGANIDSANWTNQTGFAAVLALTSGSSFTAMINGTSTTVTLGGSWSPVWGSAYDVTVTVSPSITFSGPTYVIPTTITVGGGGGSGSGSGTTVTLTLYTMGYISGYAYVPNNTTSFDPIWHGGVFFIDTEAHATALVAAAPTTLTFNDSYSNTTWSIMGVSNLTYNANSFGPSVYPVSLQWSNASPSGPSSGGTATLAYTTSGGGSPSGDITGNITSISVLSNWGYLADFSYYGGSLSSTPSGIMNSFYWDGAGMSWVKFNEGTYGSLTVSGGQIVGHTSFSLTINGVTKTFQWASYISMYSLAEPGDVLGLQTYSNQQKAYSITLL